MELQGLVHRPLPNERGGGGRPHPFFKNYYKTRPLTVRGLVQPLWTELLYMELGPIKKQNMARKVESCPK